MKLCRDCKHFHGVLGGPARCMYGQHFEWDPVYGHRVFPAAALPCHVARRAEDGCGPNGKHFAPKKVEQGFFAQLFNWQRSRL